MVNVATNTIESHPVLVPGPGQKVEYHTHTYYDGWEGVPDRYKTDGWVLIRHTSRNGGAAIEYSFQRLVGVDETETPAELGQDGVDRDARARQDAERGNQGAMVEIVELRARLREMEDREQSRALVPVEHIASAAPVLTLDALRERQKFLESVVFGFFKKGIHYGEPFPNSKDTMLYKMGAEWIASSFGCRPDYDPLDQVVERGAAPFVHYRYRCNLRSIHTDQIVGSAVGQCNSEEDKYKYRAANYKCPSCGKEAIMASKWGGWYCNAKKDGCGTKYPKGEASIENQPTPGRTLNTEVVGLAHTIDAIAQKRAFVLAVREAFGLSSIFKYFESLDEPENGGPAVIIDGKVVQKAPAFTPVEVDQLIDFAISLDPARLNTYRRTTVGDSVLAALGMHDWSEPPKHNMVEAELMIRAKVLPAVPPTPEAETAPEATVICAESGCDQPGAVTPVGFYCPAHARAYADALAVKS